MNDIFLGLKKIPFPPCWKCFIVLFVSNPLSIFTSLLGSVTAQGCLRPFFFFSNSISFPST